MTDTYHILTESTPGQLAIAVNEEIASGWTPAGGVTALALKGGTQVWAQAMVKED